VILVIKVDVKTLVNLNLVALNGLTPSLSWCATSKSVLVKTTMTTVPTVGIVGDIYTASTPINPSQTIPLTSNRLSSVDENAVADDEDDMLGLVGFNEMLFQTTDLLIELRYHHLEWIESINCIYCSLCKFCIQRDVSNSESSDGHIDQTTVRGRNINATLRHLKEKHKKGVNVIKKLRSLLEQCDHDLITKRGTELAAKLLSNDKENYLLRVSCPEDHLPRPVQLLEIQEGLMCRICGYCTVNIGTMKNHHTKHHKNRSDDIAQLSGTDSTQQKFAPRLVQQIFAATKKSYFPVCRYVGQVKFVQMYHVTSS